MWLEIASAARKVAVRMATPIDFRAWARVLRRWAATVNDQITAAWLAKTVTYGVLAIADANPSQGPRSNLLATRAANWADKLRLGYLPIRIARGSAAG